MNVSFKHPEEGAFFLRPRTYRRQCLQCARKGIAYSPQVVRPRTTSFRRAGTLALPQAGRNGPAEGMRKEHALCLGSGGYTMCPGRAGGNSLSLAGHGLRMQLEIIARIIGPSEPRLGLALTGAVAIARRFGAVSPGGLANEGQRGREEIAVFAPSLSHGSSIFEVSVVTSHSHGTPPRKTCTSNSTCKGVPPPHDVDEKISNSSVMRRESPRNGSPSRRDAKNAKSCLTPILLWLALRSGANRRICCGLPSGADQLQSSSS